MNKLFITKNGVVNLILYCLVLGKVCCAKYCTIVIVFIKVLFCQNNYILCILYTEMTIYL